jgi:signal peptidase II
MNQARLFVASLVAAAVFTADQASKHAVIAALVPGDVRPAIPYLLDWTLVKNFHGAYGLFGDKSVVLIGLGAVVLVGLWVSLRAQLAQSRAARIAYGAIVGGAIGNIADRLHYGFVVDFISVRPMPFFEVFNVADSAIVLGMVTLVLLSFIEKPAPRAAA